MSWAPFEPMDLFEEGAGAPVDVYRGYFGPNQGRVECLLPKLDLQQLQATVRGKTFPAPRLEGWWGDRPYAFGGRVVEPRTGPWPQDLWNIKWWVENGTIEHFDSCFVNYYRDESDHIPWHADDESWIGPVVASVSFGSTRRFWLRRKDDHKVGFKGHLSHGDLLVMKAGCQDEWEHRVPKETKPTGPRINLTFRQTIRNGEKE